MNPSDCPPIVTAPQMQAIDRYAIGTIGIPSLVLMENAGRGIFERIRDRIFDGICDGKVVSIICGRGNNGGDGFVVGRYLAEAGASVTFYLLGRAQQLKGDAQINAEKTKKLNLTVHEIDENSPIPDFKELDLLVDAIFGTGFHGEITGVTAQIIDAMNQANVPIVAVDTPSGLDSDTGELSVHTVRANYTMTLAASKRGQWLWPGRGFVGSNATIDIGITQKAFDSENLTLALITEEFVSHSLPVRPPNGHKGTFGKALLIGGSVGMTGAIAMSARSALRSGLGQCFVAVPSSVADGVDTAATEALIRPVPEVRPRRCLARRALGEIVKLWENMDATAIGPGLGTHHETQELTRRLIQRRTLPTVLDADGLNACAKDTTVFQSDNSIPLILTPHVAEMGRLLGKETDVVVADREAYAREAAAQFNCIVVMKGAPTFVADPSGQIYLNPTGNSGMATGGSGDVLTGIIVSLLAQGCDPLVAALVGVYLHGAAGDLAAAEWGERSMVASDMIEALPEVLLFLDNSQ